MWHYITTIWLICSMMAGGSLSEKVFTKEPKDYLLPRGSMETIKMECAANIDNPTYQWMKDLELLDTSLDAKYEFIGGTLLIKNPDEYDVGGYQCVVRMGENVVASNFGNVTLAFIDGFDNGIQYQMQVSEGAGAELECRGQGAHEPERRVSYMWEKKSVDLKVTSSASMDKNYYVSGRTGSLYFANTEVDDTANYQCKKVSRGWTLNGQSVRKSSAEFRFTVTPSGSTSSGVQFLLKPEKVTYAVLDGNVYLECFASGNPTPTISWEKIGGKLPKVRKQIGSGLFKFSNLKKEDEGVYRCRASNGVETKTVDTTVQYEYEPQWVESISSLEVDMTTTAILNCAARGSPQVTIFWLKNGVKMEQDGVKVSIIASQTEESVLYIHNFSEADEGMYQCVAYNKHGTILSSAQLRGIDEAPTFIKSLDDFIETAVGGSITLPCQVSAAPPASITWYKDGEELDVYDQSRLAPSDNGLQITYVELNDAGFYSCSASNFLDTINSTGKLMVYDETKIVSFDEPDESYVAGDLILLSCKATFDASLALTWTWKFNGNKIKAFGNDGFDVQGSSLEVLASSDKAGLYECTASTSVSQDSAEMVVKVNDVPGKPTSLTTQSKAKDSMYVTWQVPLNEFSPLQSQNVQGRLYDYDNPGPWFDAITDPKEITTEQTCLVTNLRSYNFYQFRVRATNDLGTGEYSEPSEPTRTRPGEPSKAPLLYQGGGGQAGELVVEWEPLNSADYGADSVTYLIKTWRYNTSEESARTNFEANPLENRTIFKTDVDEIYKPYHAKIQAQNSVGLDSAWSEMKLVYSGEIPPNETVSEVSTEYRKSYSLIIRWKAIENINGFTKGYKVCVVNRIADEAMVNPETWQNYTTVDEKPWIEVDNLTAKNAYNYKVAPFNAAGLGPFSEWQGPVMTRQHPPSKAPTNLDLKVQGTKVTFSWDKVVALTNQEPIVGYKVSFWKDGQDKSDAVVRSVRDTEMTYNMPERTEYLIAVRAYSSGGNGPQSEALRFSTNIGLSIKQTGGAAATSANSLLMIASTLLMSCWYMLAMV